MLLIFFLYSLLMIAMVRMGLLALQAECKLPAGCTDRDIEKAAQNGKMLQAVSWYRALHGVAKREAKIAVTRMIGR